MIERNVENDLSNDLDLLSQTEYLVYQVLMNGSAKSTDVAKIAKLCNLTDLQVIVSIQLLIYKGVLPAGKILQ